MITSRSINSTAHPKDEHKLFSEHLMVNVKKESPSKKMAKSPSSDLDNQDYSYYRKDSSVSIPFTWESQPGTPKVAKFRESSLPPLTPPPSYCHSQVTERRSQTNNNKSSFARAMIFPKKEKRFSPSLSYSSSSSSSSYNSPIQSPSSTPSKVRGRFKAVSIPRAVGQRRVDQDEEDEVNGSPVSTLCFGRISLASSSRSRPGCYSSLIKVLLS